MSNLQKASQFSELVPTIGNFTHTDINLMTMPSAIQTFIKQSMLNKPVTSITMIGPQTAKNFIYGGITHAFQIYGQFLLFGMDGVKFKQWLSTFGCNNGQQQQIYLELYCFAITHL